MTPPHFDPEESARQINALSRQPFRNLLNVILAAQPTQGAIADLAEKHPDRYGQFLALVARLGGFNEKLEVEGTLQTSINSLSDAELAARVAAFNATSVRTTDAGLANPNEDKGLEGLTP